MKHSKIHKYIAVLLAVGIVVASSIQIHTYAEESKSSSEQIEELKKQQEEAEKEAKELEDAKKKLQETLGDMNSDMYNLSRSISDTQDQIAAKEQEIADATELLNQAEEQSQKQYDDMKKRIQFMYENGNDSAWVMLLESGSVSEFLSRIQYITQVSDYDRDMLTAYQETQKTIASNKVALEQQKEELVATQKTLQDKEANLNQMIASKQQELSTTDNQQQESQEQADEYAKRVDAMIEYEKQLEAKKAAELAAKMEEIKKQEQAYKDQLAANGGTTGSMEVSVSEEFLLAAIIHCESRGESYEGQVAVGSVVLNRVDSAYFPNTIAGVIYQSGQFSPVASGRLADVLESGKVNESCMQAAKEVLAGNRSLTSLYFHVYDPDKNEEGIVIGNHIFL